MNKQESDKYISTSSIVPIPMALPRRPYLLGLFSGTSNDWATQGEGSEERERARGQNEKARGRRKRVKSTS